VPPHPSTGCSSRESTVGFVARNLSYAGLHWLIARRPLRRALSVGLLLPMIQSLNPYKTGPFRACGRAALRYASLLRLSLILALLGVSLPAAAGPPPADTIVIATGTWIPYVEVEPEMPADEAGPGNAGAVMAEGVSVEIVRRAFAAAGIEVEFVSHPWTRNAQLVENGTVDAAMPYYCSADRAKVFTCSNAVVEGEQVFFHRREMDFEWSGMKDLRPYTIGATLGYFYGESFESREAIGELKVLRIARDDVNMKLLTHGRIDLFPQDKAVGYALIRQTLPPDRWGDITHHPKPLHRKSLHLIFTRATERGARFSRLFDGELAKMKESGELARLLEPLRQLETVDD
jgi:polar amino acid transport system substrate-binding protein